MRDVIADDWIRRVADETHGICDDGGGWTEPRIRSVLRLCGVSGWADDICVDTVDILKDTFRPSILYSLRLRRGVSLCGELDTKYFAWETRGRPAGFAHLFGKIPDSDAKLLLQAVSIPTWIKAFMSDTEESDSSTNVEFFGEIVYTLRKKKQNMNVSVKSRLQVGMTLQTADGTACARQCPSVSVVSWENGSCEKRGFYVFMLACQRNNPNRDSGKLYALCCGLKKVGRSQHFSIENKVYLVEMREHVKACLDIHVCSTNSCSGRTCPSTIEGGVHEIFGSMEGFPPYHA